MSDSPRQFGPVGVRLTRSSPVVVVAANGFAAHLGDLVLVDLDGARAIAEVVVTGDQLLLDPSLDPAAITRGALLAVGIEDPAVVSALGARNAEALEVARQEAGPGVTIRSARWIQDRSRLDLAAQGPEADLVDLKTRLARRLRAEIRVN